jgi:hypothetical protein
MLEWSLDRNYVEEVTKKSELIGSQSRELVNK